MNRLGIVLLLSACTLGFLGCATPEDRAKDNPTIFGSLTVADKALALKGQIRQGMTRDAVFIALGKPARTDVDKATEKWIYTRSIPREIPRWSYRDCSGPNGRVFIERYYDPIIVYDQVPGFQVTFTSDKVTDWKNL